MECGIMVLSSGRERLRDVRAKRNTGQSRLVAYRQEGRALWMLASSVCGCIVRVEATTLFIVMDWLYE